MIKVLEFWLDIEVRSQNNRNVRNGRNVFTQRLIHLWRWQRTHTDLWTHLWLKLMLHKCFTFFIHARTHWRKLMVYRAIENCDATEMCETKSESEISSEYRSHSVPHSLTHTCCSIMILNTDLFLPFETVFFFSFTISKCCSLWFSLKYCQHQRIESQSLFAVIHVQHNVTNGSTQFTDALLYFFFNKKTVEFFAPLLLLCNERQTNCSALLQHASGCGRAEETNFHEKRSQRFHSLSLFRSHPATAPIEKVNKYQRQKMFSF